MLYRLDDKVCDKENFSSSKKEETKSAHQMPFHLELHKEGGVLSFNFTNKELHQQTHLAHSHSFWGTYHYRLEDWHNEQFLEQGE